jgi:hypothetical protein
MRDGGNADIGVGQHRLRRLYILWRALGHNAASAALMTRSRGAANAQVTPGRPMPGFFGKSGRSSF